MVVLLQAEETPAFRFWLDRSYGSCFWDALLETVRHHSGKAFGFLPAAHQGVQFNAARFVAEVDSLNSTWN